MLLVICDGLQAESADPLKTDDGGGVPLLAARRQVCGLHAKFYKKYPGLRHQEVEDLYQVIHQIH